MPGNEIPEATLTDILEELKSQRNRKKDVWDRIAGVAALLTTIATIALGVAGFWFTHSYNTRQIRISEMQTVEKFIPYLTAENQKQKKWALLVITSLGSPEFVTKLAKIDSSAGTQAAADVVMATGSSNDQQELPASVTSKPASSEAQPGAADSKKKKGWVYLGHYVETERRWEKRYFDFGNISSPDSMVSSTPTVRRETGTINVRTGMPSLAGEFQKVCDVLKPPSQVKILAVQEWYSTGYMWAQIEYEI